MTISSGLRNLVAPGCLWVFAVTALGQESDGTILSQEYFVQQSADEVLLVRVNTFEAEFTSRVLAPTGEQLSAARVAGSSLAPVFHFIASVAQNRQLDLQVESGFFTNRSRFELELNRLTVRDERTNQLARGYQYLAWGVQVDDAAGAAGWSVKVNSLLNAASIFQGFGMEELRLWSIYFAAWLVHRELGDQNTVLDYTDQILTSVRIMPFRDIELAALQLQGQALASLRQAGSLAPPESGPDPVQAMLERAAARAAAMGYRLEQARALFASGLDFEGRALYASALEQFDKALEISGALEAGELSTAIRERKVAIHDTHGDVIASGAVLQEIESQLAEAGASDELAENLLAQGRLFNQTYRYPQAIAALDQALEHEHNSLTRARAHLELARAHLASGGLEQALTHARNAVVNPRTGTFRRPNSILDTGVGLGIMANTHRARGEFARVRELRAAQEAHMGAAAGRAAFLYEQGLDRLAEGGSASAQAEALFRGAGQAADRDGQAHWRHLSNLQLCILNAASAACGDQALRQAHQALQAGGIPAAAAEGAWLLARIQLNAGQPMAAAATLDRLLDEMHFLRRVVPGVLGAWYWRNRETVYAAFLTLMNRRNHPEGEGFWPLLALSKIRFTENTAGLEHLPWPAGVDADALRVLLARREHPEAGESVSGLGQRIDAMLGQAREAYSAAFGFLSEQGLQAWLDSLDPAEAILTYHLGDDSAYALLGRTGRVERISLSQPRGMTPMLDSARQRIATLSGIAFDRQMDELGRLLLAPLMSRLPATVYFAPSGSLMGVPLDGLRLGGRYLGAEHRVVNLLTFPSRLDPGDASRTTLRNGVFLAGDPSDWSGEYLTHLVISPEIRAVTEVFVGPGLNIVQGGALQPDEFADDRFLNASLVHLSMPAYLDLWQPGNSSLELSEAGRGLGRTRLGLEAIRRWRLRADLVVLSSARLGGQPLSRHDSRLALVRTVLDAGSESVIASLWTGQSEDTAAMVGDFYRRLAAGAGVAQALAESKRARAEAVAEEGPRDWARLQLYIE